MYSKTKLKRLHKLLLLFFPQFPMDSLDAGKKRLALLKSPEMADEDEAMLASEIRDLE